MKHILVVLTALLLIATQSHAQSGTRVFQLDSIGTVRITFPYDAWKDTLAANYESRREVPCIFVAFGDTLDSVGVRYKGNSSYGLFAGTKKSFKFDFNEFVSGQQWDNLKMINFNNSFKDPTLMREVLMYQYLAEEGCDAPRVGYVNVYVNGELRGLYVAVEEVNDEFLDDHFGNAGNNLYKGDPNGTLQWMGGDTNQYRTRYEKHTNEELDDWSDLMLFIDRLNNTAAPGLVDTMESLLDIASLMRFEAVNTLFVNLDAYQGTGHNYYLYHRPDERFEMIPWDVNEAFGNFSFGMNANTIKTLDVFYLNNPPTRPLFNRLWATQTMKDMVLHDLWNTLRSGWSPTMMGVKIDALYSLIQSSVYADTCKQYTNAQFETNINSDIPTNPPGTALCGLRSFVSARTTSVNTQVTNLLGARTVIINEVLASNASSIADELGDYDDCIELYNTSSNPLFLAGYSLTDDVGNPTKYELPNATIAGNGFLVIWCDNETQEGFLHAPFELDADKEAVYLFNANASRMLDHVQWDSLTSDISYARTPLTYAPWRRVVPTMGGLNGDNIPPLISTVTRLPYVPTHNNAVTISARIWDIDGTLTQTTLAYDAGEGYQLLAMADDGLHGDSAAGDGRFGAFIPQQSSGDTVDWYIEARDNETGVSRHPLYGAVEPEEYVVDRAAPGLVVNEFMAQNNSTIEDESGSWEDWVEIHNYAETPVALEGFGLTDNFSSLHKWDFPDTTVEPGGFILVWCDEDGGDPGLHASFKLSASGERVALVDRADYGSAVLDSLSFGAQSVDISYARTCDAGSAWEFDSTPTPDQSNGACPATGLTVYRVGDDIHLRWQEVRPSSEYQVFRLTSSEEPVGNGLLLLTTSAESVVLSGEALSRSTAFYVVVTLP